MRYHFDTRLDRRPFYSVKWCGYDPEILPLPVADMDFATAPSNQQALAQLAGEPVELCRLVPGVREHRRAAELVARRLSVTRAEAEAIVRLVESGPAGPPRRGPTAPRAEGNSDA